MLSDLLPLTRSMARDMLNTLRLFGNVTESQYKKGRELITKEFKN